MIVFWSSVAALLVAIAGCGYLVAAAILVGRFARQPMPAGPATAPAVTILKPLHGDEQGLFDNLASFDRQRYPGPVQIICGVMDADDPAIAVVERLRNAPARHSIELVVNATPHGANRKIANLANMAAHIRHDVVVISDSDIRVEPDYLARVVAALHQPGVGAVTCLYHGDPASGIWAQFGALAINAHFLPSVVLSLALGLARPCFGSTIALERARLAQIGGFAAFADRLDDDYAIGAALREQGHAISIPPFTIAHLCSAQSLRELWRHELRWARTIRSIAPLGYAGSIVTHPLPWALLASLIGAASGLLVPAIAATLGSVLCRIALLRQIEQRFGLPPQPYGLVPARDLLSVAVFIAGFLGRDVSWRGRRYRLASGKIAERGSSEQ